VSDPDPTTHEFPAVERRGHGKLYDDTRHPRARASDGGWRYWTAWCYRMLVPAVAVVIAAIAVARTQGDVQRQKEGRAIAIDVLCGFGNGVAEAGRKALAGELRGQDSRQGLPEEAQRDYVGTITSTLLAEAGITARDVVQPDGTVACDRLRVVAKATHR
jgi:hypothetical protein